MDNRFAELLQFLEESLVRKGFTITHSAARNPDGLPVIDGYQPDLVGSYKNVKTVYGKVELPEDVFTREQWARLRALSNNSAIPLYVAFPEENKMELILSLINGKLADRTNIIRLYK